MLHLKKIEGKGYILTFLKLSNLNILLI